MKVPESDHHVKFKAKPIIKQLCSSHQYICDLPTIDPEESIMIKEFGRQIKRELPFKNNATRLNRSFKTTVVRLLEPEFRN